MMKKLLLFFFILLTTLAIRGQIVNIPDVNFKNALLTHNPVIDLNADGQIQVSEAVAFSNSMGVGGKNISDMTGIEAFVNLNELDCSRNNLTTLPLVGLNRLTQLVCYQNFLTTLDLSTNTNLRVIQCSNNQINSLPLNNLNLLDYLDCSNNQISALSVPNPAILTVLWCFNNQMTALQTGMTSLKRLFCNKNLITSIPGGMNALTHLDCSNNLITSLTVDNCASLNILRFGNNLCTGFSLTNKPSLSEITCDSNQLASLSISAMPALTDLECSANQLTSLSLNNFPLLRNIRCSYNQLSLLQLNNLPAVRQIYAGNNLIVDLSLSNFPFLSTLHINDNQLSTLSLSGLPSLSGLYCPNNQLTQLDLSGVPVKALDCTGNPNLSYINIRNNAVSANPYYLTVTGLFNLLSVCVDDLELIYITTIVNAQLPGQNVSISTLCTATGNYNTIIGTVRFDQNINGCNNLDSTMKFVRIDIADGIQQGSTFTNYLGTYRFLTQFSPDTLMPVFSTNWFTISPPSQIFSFTGFGNTAIADFCITANGIHPDLETVLIPVTWARPGFNATYKLVFKNKGNQFQNGTVTLGYNNTKLNFISATPPVSIQIPGNLTWNYSGLSPYETRTIDLVFKVAAPPIANSGDTLLFISTVNPVAGDESPGDNIFNLQQVIVNSFDPNDKRVLEGSRINIDKLNDFLHYMVRFQNTGTTDAIRVIIKDSLSNKLDWNSFKPIIASHPYRVVITKGNLVEFIFDGINLPPKSINEPASNGFISFKIKPKSNLAAGDIIQNTARIYFDINPPVVTNTVTTTIYKSNRNNFAGLTIYSNPAKDYLSFSVQPGVEIKGVSLFNMMGQKMNVRITESTSTTRKIDVSNFANGVYVLELISNLGKVSQKVMIVK